MSFLLDTDICSVHFRRPSGLAHRFIQHAGQLYVSTVTLAELYSGAYHLPNPQPLLKKIEELLQDVVALDFNAACAMQFGKTRGELLQRGISVPTADMMIAATALFGNHILVTHNTADFQQIPSLQLNDWLMP